MLGTRSLTEILGNREEISQQMQGILDEATDPWGVKVELVEMCVCAIERSEFNKCIFFLILGKMCVCQCNFNGPWPLKLKRLERPKLRCANK